MATLMILFQDFVGKSYETPLYLLFRITIKGCLFFIRHFANSAVLCDNFLGPLNMSLTISMSLCK